MLPIAVFVRFLASPFKFCLKPECPSALIGCCIASGHGAQAVEYLSGEGAYADRRRYPLPSLLLLDINMPKMSGFEVLEWIRQNSRFKSLPVVILTSSSRAEDRAKATQLGADDYLLKPSNPRKLVEVVKLLQERWLA